MDPTPGSSAERQRFETLQRDFAGVWTRMLADPRAPRTVVVVPSLTLDPRELGKISGVCHYEERMLCMLMLLRLPRTQVIYVSSQPLASSVVDYFLHLLPGVPGQHARDRLQLFACHDASSRSLTAKLLERPRLLARIREAIRHPVASHLAVFNSTPLEQTLSVRLGVPLFGCDPLLAPLGSKTGGRRVFAQAGVLAPPGLEGLGDRHALLEATAELRRRHPELRKVVVKLNEGFSGEGNALLDLRECPSDVGCAGWIRDELPRRLRFEAQGECWEAYAQSFDSMGGIVEGFIDGEEKRSPSAQCRIEPGGQPVVISTHDQVLGGPSGQVFLGCTFPADAAYRLAIQEAGRRVGQVLAREGAVGRFGVDFVSVREGDTWKHYAIEINLRKGGTTHPFMMLQFLTDGFYDDATGEFRIRSGEPRAYYATDNLINPRYRGLTPQDLIDIAVCQDLHFHGTSQTGVAFHLISALSEFGKLGLVAIAEDAARAHLLYERTVQVLDRETA